MLKSKKRSKKADKSHFSSNAGETHLKKKSKTPPAAAERIQSARSSMVQPITQVVSPVATVKYFSYMFAGLYAPLTHKSDGGVVLS